MKIGQTYLMSSNELSLIAAASGMDSFLMFDSRAQHDRGTQMQSVLRLIADGFLINNGTAITPGPSLAPLLEVFKSASTAVVAKLSSREAAPICIYFCNSREAFLRIIPHAQRDEIYEVSTTALDALLDDLESLHFLPVLFDWQIGSLGQLGDNSDVSDRLKDKPHTIFEKIDLSAKTLIGQVSITQDSSVWAMSTGLEPNIEHTCYSRDNFIEWLMGGTT